MDDFGSEMKSMRSSSRVLLNEDYGDEEESEMGTKTPPNLSLLDKDEDSFNNSMNEDSMRVELNRKRSKV